MQIELTKEEVEALLKLIEVRSDRLQTAELALFFTRKISAAARITEVVEPPKLVDKDVA